MTLAELEQLLHQNTERALAALATAQSADELESCRLQFLGQKGFVTQAKKSVGQLATVDEKKRAGKLANDADAAVSRAYDEHKERIERTLRDAELSERMDVTLPGRRSLRGKRHPLTLTSDDILDVLGGLGFMRAEGPEIEHDWYNFEALNVPREHPARDMQDTFYIDDDVVLRTHTSPVQVRAMLAIAKPPIRVACYGRVYRNDHDITHSPMFHPVEGLYVDQSVTFGDLKGTLQVFLERIFGPRSKVRLRPSFFPFTEPSVEVDVSCFSCGGTGTGGATVADDGRCRLCKATGWIEIMGAGMVDPEVLRFGGLDPDRVTGFAFGIGVERVAMLRYGVSDIRLFFENDRRFLRQF